MAAKENPTLPAELWLRVLQNLQKMEDLPELWTSHRYVCTAFKHAVEVIMRENHLRKTWIKFQFGNLLEEEGNEASFIFSHLSEEKIQATFKIDETDDRYKPKIRKHLRKAVKDRLIEGPQYEIQIHRDINDGPIPGLSIDYENLELTCDWREMFSIFYGEEQIYHQHLRKWVKDQEAWTVGLREKMERGELDMEKLIEQAVGGFASGSEHARKIARRARIRREYRRLDGTEWDADLDGDVDKEKEALKRLKESRFFCSFETHSDDEDEDEDEHENDEDEDEEWEDTDNECGEADEAADSEHDVGS